MIRDAVWWFYLFWGGKFLFDKFGLSIKNLALPLITIYVIADVGSVVGGWMSSFFIKRGWTVNRARKTTLFIGACSIGWQLCSRDGRFQRSFNAAGSIFQRAQTAHIKIS